MGTEIYKTLLEDLNKGEEVALITKYNLETKKVEKNIYNLEDFIKMTPLTSGLSKEQINELNKCDIEKITVDLKIIVGKVK